MAITREDKDGNIALRIEGALSIYEAAALRGEILSCLEEDTGLELDLEGVTECDTAGLQLLWAARKTAAEAKKALHIVNTPQPVLDALQGAGLRSEEPF